MICPSSVRIPGTCGELVQGVVNGQPFLVSCPIDLYATATVELTTSPLPLVPGDAPKAAAALRAALGFFGRSDLSARLCLASSLPRGKGMGSSTADIAAVIFAVAGALDRGITPSQVAALAVSIEPSDAAMFPNIALFDHRHGLVYEDLGPPPPLDIVVVDFGGEVDTVDFNRQDRSAQLHANEPMVAEALRLVRRGIREGRVDIIARGATLSAEANQRILYKPELAAVQEFAREVGALGVNVAHSGTVIGILVDPGRLSAPTVLHRARQSFQSSRLAFVTRLVGGGPRPAGPFPSQTPAQLAYRTSE